MLDKVDGDKGEFLYILLHSDQCWILKPHTRLNVTVPFYIYIYINIYVHTIA